MKAYVMTTGTLFGLVTAAHGWEVVCHLGVAGGTRDRALNVAC